MKAVTALGKATDSNQLPVVLKEDLREKLPVHIYRRMDDRMIDALNEAINEPDWGEHIFENFVTYSNVIAEGNVRLAEYLNAVRYCTYRLAGMVIKEAYMYTFPDRVARWDEEIVSDDARERLVYAYNKTKMVEQIMKQSAIPLWIHNQGRAQEVLNQLFHLAMNAKSEKVRVDSADAFLKHTKVPEAVEMKIDIGVTKNPTLTMLHESMQDLIQKQQDAIASGKANAAQIAAMEVIEHEDD